jgi:predicted MFS family arabinose efflux permease
MTTDTRKDGERLHVVARYTVALVWLTLVLRVVDLQVVSVLLEPLRKEFQVSDTQLGLLSGFAFSVFYGVLGIPVAWLADRANRRNIIAVAIGLWSAMTMMCGLASSFPALLLARLGVGIGEAGGSAPAYSLVSDITDPARRARTFAFLSAAVPTGIFIGMAGGGWINAHYGWRNTFVAFGAVGLIVSLLVFTTLREPPRLVRADEQRLSLRLTLKDLLGIGAYRHLVMASSLFTMGAVGSGIWIAAFFIRVHEIPPAKIAAWLGVIYGAAGVAGALLGGWLAERLQRRQGDAGWQTRLACLSTAAIIPIAGFVYLLESAWIALALHVVVVLLMHIWMGPTYGLVQTLAGPGRRATAAALNMLVINVLAYGAGPLLVGAVSDALAPQFGAASLRYAILLVVVVCYGWAAVHFARAGRTLIGDLQRSGDYAAAARSA